MKLYRSRFYRHVVGGQGVVTVHCGGCRHLRSSHLEWNWANGKPASEIFAHWWNVPCKVCRPDKALAREEG